MSGKSLLQHRALGDVAGEALCLNNLADLHLVMGDNDSAHEYLRESLALCERHGLDNTRAIVIANLSEIAMKKGRLDEAEEWARKAMDLVEVSGHRSLACWINIHAADIAVQRSELTKARTHLATGMEIAISMARPSYQFLALSCLSKVLVAQGAPECARSVLSFCLAHPALPAPERDNIRKLVEALPRAKGKLAWSGTLDELVNRVVVEDGAAYAPLIADLRAATEPSSIAS